MTINNPSYRFHPAQTLRHQRGVTLIISLIMLIAMTLAGLAMVRQSGTGIIIARNLTFKQAALVAADRGVEEARVWISGQAAGTLQNSVATAGDDEGYYPAWCNTSVDSNGRPDANIDGVTDNCAATPAASAFTAAGYNWGNSFPATDDGSGYSVRYVIHRMCSLPGALEVSGQECVQFKSDSAASGHKGAGNYASATFTESRKAYYRITTRVSGPLNTTVYTQAIIN